MVLLFSKNQRRRHKKKEKVADIKDKENTDLFEEGNFVEEEAKEMPREEEEATYQKRKVNALDGDERRRWMQCVPPPRTRNVQIC